MRLFAFLAAALLLAAFPAHAKPLTVVAAENFYRDRAQRKWGENPHLGYDRRTRPAVAGARAAEFASRDPAHRQDYESRLQVFLASLEPMNRKITALRQKYAGQPVTATEPVFGYM